MYISLEYYCDTCGHRTESLELRRSKPDTITCLCGAEAERCMSAPAVHMPWGSVALKGERQEKPHPDCIDTRDLADGMSRAEWKEKRRNVHRDARIRHNRASMS
jgi:hypothetical protein